MASRFSFSLISLFLFLSFSSTTTSATTETNCQLPTKQKHSTPPEILQACKATRFEDVCVSSLSNSNVSEKPTPLQIIQSAISVSFTNLKTAQSVAKAILDASRGNINRTKAAKSCMEVLNNSQYLIAKSTDDFPPRGKIKDARAWMSAALLFQYDCFNALLYANDTMQTRSTMSSLNTLISYTRNALSMIVSYDVFGNETKSWCPPKTERDGFWEFSGTDGGSGSGFPGGFPSELSVEVTVCKEGSQCKCDHKTIQDAVNTAPDNASGHRYVIRIKEGVYEEIVRVPLEKKNVVFLGDGVGKTVITGSLNAGQPGVLGDGFMASGLTIKNTALTFQSVAFRSDSDKSVIENCEFLSNQDTLYARSLQQFYKSCRIKGNVDFIFGNSASVFQDCQIFLRPRLQNPEKGESNTITAHGRRDPAQATGFIFRNCSVNGTEEYMKLYRSNPSVHKGFLGRPWKEYSRVVFIQCSLEAFITPEGWSPWKEDFALKTLYYGEFENSGPGSNSSKRVAWRSQIPEEHVPIYSVKNFIQGDEWMTTSSC